MDPLCYLDVPAAFKTHHRAFSADFRTVIIGNFWRPELLADVCAIWSELQRTLPGLPAIRWHCHPGGIERIRRTGINPEPQVETAPFLSGEALFSTLREADMALIPFSRQDEPDTDYERFSMPSRLTELCPAGIPIFCLTGRGTPFHDYVVGHGIARCAPAGDRTRAVTEIAHLIHDTAARERLGGAARHHAEAHFQLAPFQNWLGERLRTIAGAHRR
jgi:hypothetical protein